MMFEFPKLVFLIVVFAAIWIVYRWLNGPMRELQRRRATRPQRSLPAEDLVACGLCGAYVAAHSPACARPDCPQPR
jgi:hypothetical protein